MAVLSKIRQRSFFLIIIIALALFAFVLADVIKSGTFGTSANSIGTIDGTDINARDFNQKVAQNQQQQQQQQQNASQTQAMNTVWEQEIRDILLGKEIEKSGLKIGSEKMMEVLKPYFSQAPQYLNEAGQFDENKFKEGIKAIKNSPNKEQWTNYQQFEKDAEKNALQQLYFNLVKGSAYTTKAEGQFQNVIENSKASFDYVTVAYSTIKDEEVKVSDDEIIAYMKKNDKKYKSENTRSIDYVFFQNKPSEEDGKALTSAFNDILYGSKTDSVTFKNAQNVKEYVNARSEIPYDTTYLVKASLPVEFQEQLFNLSVGEVFGPYVDNGSQKVSRVMGKKANASVNASHILLSFEGADRATSNRTEVEAKKLADDLLAKIRANPADFALLAAQNSEDPGSKDTGGVYNDIMPGTMVTEFNDFVFNNPVGATGVVKTTFGYHVMKVLAKNSAIQLATISKSIQPSEKTVDAIYAKATKFENDLEGKNFKDVAKAAKLEVASSSNMKSSEEYIQGIGSQREVVRWAFNKDTSKGDVKRFETPEGYMIAIVTDVNNTGLLPMDTAKESVGTVLRNEKKAALIKKKMSGATLSAIAKATGGTVMNAVDLSVNMPSIPNVGNEPKVVGTAFATPANKVSALIEGATGVFVIEAKSVTKAADMPNYKAQIDNIQNQAANSAAMKLYQALKDKVKIEDNRGNF